MSESANVDIIISALTEAAENSIDRVGDEIRGLTGDSEISQKAVDQLAEEFEDSAQDAMLFMAALNQVEQQESEVTRASIMAQSAIEQVGDALEESRNEAIKTSAAYSGLSLSTEGLAVNMGVLSSSLTLTLIPALMTLLTVLAPLVALLTVATAGAAALAGAFGAIIGSGILAFGKKKAKQNKKQLQQTRHRIQQLEAIKERTGTLNKAQQKQLSTLKSQEKRLEDGTKAMGAFALELKKVKEEVTPLIAEFGKSFIPLIKGMLNSIPRLVEKMIDAVGGTRKFQKALSDLGAVGMQVIPALVGFMFDLARTALPYAKEFFNWLMDNGPSIWKALKNSAAELEPQVRSLIDALIENGPALLEFGTTAAKVVFPALEKLIEAATGFMETVNKLPAPLNKVVAGFLAFLPIIVKLVGLLGSLTSWLGMGGLTGVLKGVAGVLAGTIGGAVALGTALGLLGVKILSVTGVLDKVYNAGKAVGDMMNGPTLDAFLSVISVLSMGVIPAIAAVGAAVTELVQGDVSGAVKKAKQVFGIFSGAWSRTVGRVLGGVTDLKTGFVEFFTKTIPKVVTDAVEWIKKEIGKMEELLFGWIDDLNKKLEGLKDVVPGIGKPDKGNSGGGGGDESGSSGGGGGSGGGRGSGGGGGGGEGQTINGGINIEVQGGDEVSKNPYLWSRKAGAQLERETRREFGVRGSGN